MPRCQNCGDAVNSYDLRVVNDVIVCTKCRKPKAMEYDMIESKKRVVSVTLNEIPTPDNTIDHELEVEGEYAGLKVSFNTTFDKIRTFFTQQREKGKKAKLQSIN